MFKYNGYENIFKSSLDIFNPKRWIPAVVPYKAPIYPYKSETFCVCQSQKSCQLLTEDGGFSKYLCKYVARWMNKITSTSLWITRIKTHMHQIKHIYIILK